uniref:Uncharacterized protein n=1 Tax=Aegilops tauschii TaxID=37682 RepID=M8BBJ9_AEGTA
MAVRSSIIMELGHDGKRTCYPLSHATGGKKVIAQSGGQCHEDFILYFGIVDKFPV